MGFASPCEPRASKVPRILMILTKGQKAEERAGAQQPNSTAAAAVAHIFLYVVWCLGSKRSACVAGSV